jgi:putative tryptophan/tyrosine transport system substrate-binding protein
MPDIKRREFITLLGGAAAWPLAARAQQPDRVRRIGILTYLASDDADAQSRNAAFLQGLQELGWAVGRNVRIDYRWGASNFDPERMRKGEVELVAIAPDVVLAASVPIVLALQQVSRTVPIVFAAAIDPVGAGLVASLARPGGNATGFTMFEYGISAKWLELLKEISPRVKRVCCVSLRSLASANSPRCRPRHHRSRWSCSRSTRAMSASSNGCSPISQVRRTVV